MQALSGPAGFGILPSEMTAVAVEPSTVKGSLELLYFYVLDVSTSLQ